MNSAAQTIAHHNASGSPVATSEAQRLPVATLAKQYTAAPDTATIETSGGDVFTLAAGEKGFVQNLGTNPLYVRKATGATSSAFHYALAAGAVADDGTGGSVEIDDHVGVVSVAGTSPRFLAWKV